MRRWTRWLDRLLGGVVAACLGVSVLVVLWQVATRYLLDDPSPWTEELVRFLLVWLGLIGGAYATGRRQHLAIELVPSRLGARGRRRLEVFVRAVVGAFAALVLVFGGGRLVLSSFELGQRSAALGLPLGVVYLALPLSGAAILVFCLAGAEVDS